MLQQLKTAIWHAPIKKLPRWKAYGVRVLRILLVTSEGFTKSQIQQGASSLTYYSLLALVPVIALFLGLARGFELEQTLVNWLLKEFPEQKTIIEPLFEFANQALKHAKGGIIAGIGVALFLWAAIKILLNIEFVLNQIWEVSKGRTLPQRFTDYLALICLAPLIILIASGLPAIVSSAFIALSSRVSEIQKLSAFVWPLLNLLPFVFLCLLFTFLYAFMPNTRVRLTPAFIAGILTGIIYQLVQWMYLYFQIGVSSLGAIYGTFAAVPLFLIWLHLSWVIILLGAKVTFAIQNVDGYGFISEDTYLSHNFRTTCSLRIAHFCVQRFSHTKPGPTLMEISNTLALPLNLAGRLVHQLIEAHILVEIKTADNQESRFQPAETLETLTVKKLMDRINERGGSLPLPPSKELTMILKSLKSFDEAIKKSSGNVLLKDMR